MTLTVSFVIMLVTIVIDQVTKMFLMSENLRFAYIPGFLYNEPMYNDGAAFSILSGKTIFFIIFTLAILLFIFYLLLTNKFSSSKFFKYSLSILAGGVIGNLIDRYYFKQVRDFWLVKPFKFICNFADVAICVGTVLICVYIIFLHDFKNKRAKTRSNSKVKSETTSNDSAGNDTIKEEK